MCLCVHHVCYMGAVVHTWRPVSHLVDFVLSYMGIEVKVNIFLQQVVKPAEPLHQPNQQPSLW